MREYVRRQRQGAEVPTLRALARGLGIGAGSVHRWLTGVRTPELPLAWEWRNLIMHVFFMGRTSVRSRIFWAATVAVASLVALANRVEASAILFTRAGVFIDGPDTDSGGTGPIQSSQTRMGTTACCGGFEYDYQLTAEARADYGWIGVYASVLNAAPFGSIADAGASWEDDFTITGAAAGTPLDFAIGFRVNGSLARAGEAHPVKVQAWLEGLPNPTTCLAPESAILCNAGVSDVLTASGRQLIGGYDQTILVELIAGQTYHVRQSLIAYLSGGFVFPTGGSSEADFLNSATFSLTALTPGGDYFTASGARYDPSAAVPVPEPSSLLLFVTGAIAATRAFRRRTHPPLA